MRQFTHGSLFAGIGGFDLGFERAGFKTVWQVEIDGFCREVLAKHWPLAERFGDVRDCGGCGQFRKDTPNRLTAVDVISGGFPCQDISRAGKRAGIDGERSGLWSEMFRIICEVRPSFVLVENVAALLNRGMERVLGDLAAGGFDAEWDVLPACAFGAPHIRERIWIIAYPRGQQYQSRRASQWRQTAEKLSSDASSLRVEGERVPAEGAVQMADAHRHSENVADSDWSNGNRRGGSVQMGRNGRTQETANAGEPSGTRWSIEPNVGRVANGVPNRVDRLKGLGNAVVPQIAEWIALRIKAQLEKEEIGAIK